MKKVLLSAYACMPGYGSEEGNGWNYSTVISQNDYQVWCLTRPVFRAKIEPQLAKAGQPNLHFVYVALPPWIENLYGQGMFGLYFHYICWQWAAFRKARLLDREHQYDLVHHISYGSLQLGSFLYKLNRPFIFGPVGGGQEAPASMRHYFRQYWLKERLRSLVSRLMLNVNPGCYKTVRQASRVLVWNEDTRQMARALGRTDNVYKEFSGVPASYIPDEPIQRTPGELMELVWVGRLLPRKALELTLHGFSKVNAQLPINLTIVGDGEMGQYMTQYRRTYSLGEHVRWVGHVDHDQVKAYYRRADVFYFTSLRDTGPAQLLEAMAYSLPVVTLNLHGQAELVSDDTGIRVPVTDSETVATNLARAIEWMYHNPDKRIQMGLNAYRFASQQTWERKISRLISTYYEPVQRQNAPAEKVYDQ